jgi:hypothetical protein
MRRRLGGLPAGSDNSNATPEPQHNPADEDQIQAVFDRPHDRRVRLSRVQGGQDRIFPEPETNLRYSIRKVPNPKIKLENKDYCTMLTKAEVAAVNLQKKL